MGLPEMINTQPGVGKRLSEVLIWTLLMGSYVAGMIVASVYFMDSPWWIVSATWPFLLMIIVAAVGAVLGLVRWILTGHFNHPDYEGQAEGWK